MRSIDFFPILRSLFLLLTVFFSFGQSPLLQASKLLEIHFLDIGQGDSIILRTPSGRNVLIDAGVPEQSKFLKYSLDKLGIKKLNLVLVTHPHLDHFGGVPSLFKHFIIRKYMDPAFPYPSPYYRRLLLTLRHYRTPTYQAKRGQLLDLGGGAWLRILAPKHPFFRDSRSNPNANSVVMRLEYKRLRVLLTGDAESETERNLLQHEAQYLPSNLLKVAHHGSRYASSMPFLRAVRPKFAIISCGRNNRYHHPHPSAIRRLKRIGAKTFITARLGSIILRSDGRQLWLSSRRRWVDFETQLASYQLPPPKNAAYKDINLPPDNHTLQKRLALQTETTGWLMTHSQGRETIVKSSYPSRKGYIASRFSKVFHRASCRFIHLIPKKDRLYFSTRKKAIRSHRFPATDCHP